jgi:hypothetical protein
MSLRLMTGYPPHLTTLAGKTIPFILGQVHLFQEKVP